MEGFCRGCLIKYDEPMELLQYTEKNRRLFVYSTGLQVKRNDTFTFQLCKDCFLNMKQACKFKKNCRTSDKRFRNYIALKDVGDPVDFCTFLKNSDDTLTFRLPMASGNSTPATQKCRDDDNESTCTSIRNFMTDILQGEEMPDTEARIIKEVIEEEADVLDDSLDSHWLQDDMSIDTDFRLDFSFSQFSTPHTVNDDRCYTPKQKEDQMTFETINTEKQTKILKDFTNAFKTDDNIEELSIFVGGVSENTESFEKLKELSPMAIDEIDGMYKSEIDVLKRKQNLKDVIIDLGIDESEGMDTSDSKIVDNDQNYKDLSEVGIQDINTVHVTESNHNLKELSNFGKDEIDSNRNMADKSNNSLKEMISNLDIEGMGKSDSQDAKSNLILKELVSNFSRDLTDTTEKPDNIDPKSNQNLKEFCDFSLDSFSGADKAENKNLKNVKSLKELCDFSLDSFEDTAKLGCNPFKHNQKAKEFCKLNINDFDDIANSGSLRNDRKIKEVCDFGIDETDKSQRNLNMPLLSDFLERDKIDTPDFDVPKGAPLGTSSIDSTQPNNDISNSSNNIEAFFNSRQEKEKIDSPDFDISKGVIDSIQSHNDASNSSINIEAFLNDIPKRDTIETPDFEIPKSVIGSIPSNNDLSNNSINIEAFLNDRPEIYKIDKPDFDIPKGIRSIQSINDISNSSINIEAFLKEKLEKDRIDKPDFEIPKGEIGSIQSNNDVSNSSIDVEVLLKDKLEKDRIDTPDFEIPKGTLSINSSNDISNSSINIQALLKDKPERDRVETPDFDLPKGIRSIQSNNDISNSSINIEALLDDKPCPIDKKLEEALKNTVIKEFSLEDILISPPVFPAASGASTPTITNILFGENLNTTDTNTKIEQCLQSYHDVQDIEIFEEFFQNDTKQFDLEDIKRVNEGFKSEDWNKAIAANDFEFANKENDSKNIEMGISIDDKDEAGINNDKAVKKSKKEPMIEISQDDENDKFNIKYLYCKLCTIRYDTSRAFSAHFAKKHKIKIVKPRKPNIKKNKEDVIKTTMEATINISDTPANDKFDFENSYCKLCNIKYNTSRALSIHFAKSHHIKIEKPKCVKMNKNHEIVCNNCGIKSRDPSNFARHLKKCSQKGMIFKCDRCQLEFTTQAHLEKHKTCHTKMRKKSTGKEFVCTICGAILHKQSNFVLHMRRHTKDYSIQCEFCDKGFYRQSDLKAHMRSHTGATEFQCKFCPKLFSRRDVLLRHLLIHLDERLYECDYCNKKFIKKYDLRKHIENESCRPRIKCKAVKKKMDLDIPQEQEKEKVEIKKEVLVEVVQDVTVIYAKGSDATIKQQLPFLETERSN